MERKDLSIEYDIYIHVQYDIYVEGRLYKSLVNMPVMVTHQLNY